MKITDLVRVRWLLSALLVAATALFVVGAAIESDSHAESVTSSESAEHDEAAEQAESAESSETVLGIDLESTPLVVVAVVISVALAAASWFTNRKLVLLVAALFAVAFAVLDIAEFAHQLEKSAAGLAVLAAIIAVLHAAATFVAWQRWRHATT